MSVELGTSLTAERVTSGRELVVSVDRQQLLARLARHVQRDPAVKGAHPRVEPKTVLPPAEIALVVQCMPGSDAHQLLRRSAQAGKRTSREIDALAARVSVGADPQPAGRVNERGELILALDIGALTQQLVERLKQRKDVQYAQVSQMVRPFGK